MSGCEQETYPTMSRHAEWQREYREDALRPLDDLRAYLRAYTRANPGAAAFFCFGLGFALGWRLKPW